MPATGVAFVVRTADFTAEDFSATDWTNLSPSCVDSSTNTGGGAAACPLPFDPSAPSLGPLPLSGSTFLPS